MERAERGAWSVERGVGSGESVEHQSSVGGLQPAQRLCSGGQTQLVYEE